MVTTTVRADCPQDLKTCKEDCKVVISAAQKALKAKDDQINAQDNTITDLQRALTDTSLRLDSADNELASWYHNPVILILGGIIVGGVGVLYLKR